VLAEQSSWLDTCCKNNNKNGGNGAAKAEEGGGQRLWRRWRGDTPAFGAISFAVAGCRAVYPVHAVSLCDSTER